VYTVPCTAVADRVPYRTVRRRCGLIWLPASQLLRLGRVSVCARHVYDGPLTCVEDAVVFSAAERVAAAAAAAAGLAAAGDQADGEREEEEKGGKRSPRNEDPPDQPKWA
jgi:hypothetical protein